MKKIFLLILLAVSLSGYSQLTGVTVVDFMNTNGIASYPVTKDSLNKGGFRVVTTIVERNAITDLRRKIGMWVYVTDSLKVYRLANTGITNSDWTEVIFSSGGSGSYNSNIGAGYRLAKPNTDSIKTLKNTYALILDSTTLNQIGFSADSATLALTFLRRKDSATASNLNGYLTRTSQSGGGGSGDSTGFGSLGGGYARNILHGFFWTPDSSYGICRWEAWLKPTTPNDNGYWISDGAGGMHNALIGWVTTSSDAAVTLNWYNGSGIITMNSVDHVPLNEWVHVAWIYDGVNMRIEINGIVSAIQAYTGVRKTLTGGSDGLLYIQGSDHSNDPGQVAQVRGIEGNTGDDGYQQRGITRHQTNYMYNGIKASFFADYSVNGTRLFIDRGVGFEARSHDGIFSNGAESPSRGIPQWIKGDVIRPETAGTPASPPGGAVIFDSFTRRNKLFLFGEFGGLDSTESGSAGKKLWQTGAVLGVSYGGGVLSGRAVMYNGQANYAWVTTSSQNADIRVDRGGDVFGTGILARYDGNDYYRIVATNTSIDFEFREASTIYFPPSFTVTGGWTTLRVVVSGTTMSVYTDGTLAGTKTIISNAAGVNHGILISSAVNWYDNFTIY